MSSETPAPYVALARVMCLLREIKGISCREHARQIGLSSATISRIENGKGCDVPTLVKIHTATGVAYNTLLGKVTSDVE